MPRTQREKLWLFGTGAVAALLLVIGYFFFVGPQRSKTDDINAQIAAAQTQNAGLQARIASLQQQAKDLPKYRQQLAQAQLALPSTSGLPDFLRTLQAIGNQTLAKVTSLSVSAPSDVTALAGAAPAPAATATAKPGGVPSGPTVGGAHVYALPISATVSGTTAQLAAFLTQLQAVQPRAVLISQLSLAGGQAGSAKRAAATPTLTLTMQAFVAPSSSAENAQLSAASHP